MADGFTWVPVNVSHPGDPDHETLRSEHLIDSAIYRDQMRARGEEVGPDVPGVNVPDDWEAGPDPQPSELPEQPQAVAVPPVALALSREQAAAALNYSVNHFDRHVRPFVREVRSGRRTTYPVAELERYLNERAQSGLL